MGFHSDGSSRLFTNGAESVAAVVRHADDIIWEKSPANTAAVGTTLVTFAGTMWVFVIWTPSKKNSLSFLIGPPKVPPAWSRCRPSSRPEPPFSGLVKYGSALNL